MKKHLLFIFCSVFVFQAKAQTPISITTTDVAPTGKIIYQANDTLPSIMVGSPSALTQTWNFSALDSNSIDTLSFLSYSSAPNNSFASSNLVVQNGSQPFYSYLKNTPTALASYGNAGVIDFGNGPVNFKQINTPSEALMIFPATYNTSYVNNYNVKVPATYVNFNVSGTQIDSIRQHSRVNKTVVVDAWGTLTTPLGTYNVIRSQQTKITHDSTDAYIVIVIGGFPFGSWTDNVQTTADSTTEYTWWANSVGFPLVTATMDSTGNVSRVQWLKTLPVTAGINEQTEFANNVIVFPNPAQDEINFLLESSKVASIQVFDIAGRMINSCAVTTDNTRLNTSQYANGIYSYSIIDKNKTIVNRGKFTIAK